MRGGERHSSDEVSRLMGRTIGNRVCRLGDAFDIAEASVYLSAPSGKFITGEVLVVEVQRDTLLGTRHA